LTAGQFDSALPFSTRRLESRTIRITPYVSATMLMLYSQKNQIQNSPASSGAPACSWSPTQTWWPARMANSVWRNRIAARTIERLWRCQKVPSVRARDSA